MKEGKLTKDVYSSVKRVGRKMHLYAKEGEVVKIISQSGNVMIVEAGNGDRFPVIEDWIIKIN